MPTRPLRTRYSDDLKLFPSWWNKVGLVIATVVVVAYPFQADTRWLTVGILTLVAIVGAVGLMILTGFTGQISLGHAAFLALGAYTAAGLAVHLGMPFWIGMLAGGLVAAGVGLAIGPFALRLRGLYLAIVTLGLIFVVNHFLRAFSSITGGLSGTPVPMFWWFSEPGLARGTFGAPISLGPLDLSRGQQVFFVYLVIVVFTVWVAKNLMRTRTGRAMASVRDRDIAAAVIGVNPASTKVIAFGISSFFTGVAGAMFAFQQQFITIDPPFNLFLSIEYIAMIVIGGVGTVFGAVAGAVVFTMLGPFAEALMHDLGPLARLTSAQQRTLLFSVIVAGFLIFEPLGLYGIWLRIKLYFMAWPFRY
jgi:branched-chain amino acid transport system permease protein